MFRTFLIAFILLVIIAIAPLFSHNNGLVVIYFGEYQIKLSLLIFTIAIFTIIAFFYLFEAVLRLLFKVFLGWWVNRKERRARKAQAVQDKGMRKLVEGDYDKAQKLLTKSAKGAATPILNLSQAIDVAVRNKDLDKAEKLLKQAVAQATPADEVLVDVCRLKFHVVKKSWDKAYALANDLRTRANTEEVNLLAAQVYKNTNSYAQLEDLTAYLLKQDYIDAPQALEYRQWVERGFISSKLDEVDNDYDKFSVWWKNQPSRRTKGVLARNELVAELQARKLLPQAVKEACQTLSVCAAKELEQSNFFELLDNFGTDSQDMQLVAAVSKNLTRFSLDTQVRLMQILARIYYNQGDLAASQLWAERIMETENKNQRLHGAETLLLAQMLYRKQHLTEKLLGINNLIEQQYSVEALENKAQAQAADAAAPAAEPAK